MCYFVKDSVLMRKYRPREIPATDVWEVYKQIILPSKYGLEILEFAHVLPTARHLGVNKVQDRIMRMSI